MESLYFIITWTHTNYLDTHAHITTWLCQHLPSHKSAWCCV